MVTSIRKGTRTHLYIEEWMAVRGLSFEDMGGRLGVSRTTVWRWSREQWRLSPPKIEQIADALSIEPRDLYRPPNRQSVDAILDKADDKVYEFIIDAARKLTGTQ